MIKSNCKYQSTDIIEKNGVKTIRKVSIKNGKGYKSISKYHKKKHIGTVRRKLKSSEIQMIKVGKFIPGLFNNCKACSRKRKG